MHFKGFLFSIGRKGIETVVLNTFLLQLFLTVFCTLQSRSMHLERKKVKLEQVEVHKYPQPAPLFNLSK